jgi:hypothetical protein
MSWSGGKDSAAALHELINADECEVVALLPPSRKSTGASAITACGGAARTAGGGDRHSLDKIYLPSGPNQPCTNDVYEQIMGGVMAG